MRRVAGVLVTVLLFASTATAAAAPLGAKVLEPKGRWESGYGAKFYNVVGRLQNTSGHPLRWVKLHVEAVDASGKVVATTDTYNESAEVLTVPEVDREEVLRSGKVKALESGAEQRFRASFLAEETPPFTDYRVKIVETPAVAP
jgi:hypothetical protein